MTEDELKAIRERADKATPGPWVGGDGEYDDVCAAIPNSNDNAVYLIIECMYKNDVSFVAHARQDIPALVAEVERLQKNNRELFYFGGLLIEVLNGIDDSLINSIREVLNRKP